MEKNVPYQKKDWYLKRKDFLVRNQKFLSEVVLNLKNEGYDFSMDDLFAMQKFYLCYPDGFPDIFKGLSWEHIKVLMNLYSSLAREFYARLIYVFHLSVGRLKEFILKDLYAKYESVLKEMSSYDGVLTEDFLISFVEIESCLYEEN